MTDEIEKEYNHGASHIYIASGGPKNYAFEVMTLMEITS